VRRPKAWPWPSPGPRRASWSMLSANLCEDGITRSPMQEGRVGIITDVDLVRNRGWKSLGTEATSQYVPEEEKITLVTTTER